MRLHRESGRPRWLPDTLAILALAALWALYFWRLFTPSDAAVLSLREGDFSGQFVAFFSYQVERLGAGEVPLWNPYNYAGHPFLADTQSAVFYPPRLLNVALVHGLGRTAPGELYAALQTEMALHVLLASLLMYAFVRRLTAAEGAARASITGGLVAALTYAYGGYLAGYPPLQLAVLEAGVWLPLALLAIFEATRAPRPGGRWLIVAGAALGLSLLAGHPQTALFALYLALAFLGYRLWLASARSWRLWLIRLALSAALIGLIAAGLAAVQLVPGLEYLRHTSRSALPYAEIAHGFAPGELVQIIFPGVVSRWSPLYIGIAGLALAGVAIWRRAALSRFFALAGLIALVWSLGAGTALFDALYLFGPGVGWFRGQERAAYLVAQCAAILTGLGAAALLATPASPGAARRLSRALWTLTSFTAIAAGLWWSLGLDAGSERLATALDAAIFATLIAALSALLLPRLIAGRLRSYGALLLLVALVWLDLFSVTRGGPNYEPVRASERLAEPAYLDTVRADLAPGARVDGLRGLFENYGTLYHVPDIRTISPLRMARVERILTLPDDRAWELLAVQTVLSDWEQLMAPSTITATAQDALGPFHVHRLDNPRPFAHLVYRAEVVPDDNTLLARLADPATGLDAIRSTALLAQPPGVTLPRTPPDDPGTATATRFDPEHLTIETETSAPAILTLALPAYPGWQAAIDGRRAPLLRAYGGLSALALPDAGAHTITLDYRPATFAVGALISLATLALLAAALVLARWTPLRVSGGPP